MKRSQGNIADMATQRELTRYVFELVSGHLSGKEIWAVNLVDAETGKRLDVIAMDSKPIAINFVVAHA